jgi:pimeloyl-ACP methyl ester carboxylesterase
MLRVSQPAPVLSWSEPAGLAARGTLIVVPGRGEQPSLYERFGARLAADAYRVHAVADPTVDAALTREQVYGLLAAPGEPAPKVLVGSDSGALFAAALAAAAGLAVGSLAALVLAGLPVAAAPAASGARPAGADQGAGEAGTNGSRTNGSRPNGSGSNGSGTEGAGTTWEAELDSRTACGTHLGRLAGPGLRRGALYEPIPADWFAAADFAAIDVPILGLHGAEDRVSPLAAARARYAAAPAAELVSIAGGRHDALNDQTHRTAAATIVLFLERLRSSPALAPIGRREQLERA